MFDRVGTGGDQRPAPCFLCDALLGDTDDASDPAPHNILRESVCWRERDGEEKMQKERERERERVREKER